MAKCCPPIRRNHVNKQEFAASARQAHSPAIALSPCSANIGRTQDSCQTSEAKCIAAGLGHKVGPSSKPCLHVQQVVTVQKGISLCGQVSLEGAGLSCIWQALWHL